MPRVTVIGTGYLGLTHAVCLADLGHEVLAIDVDVAGGRASAGLDHLVPDTASTPGAATPATARRYPGQVLSASNLEELLSLIPGESVRKWLPAGGKENNARWGKRQNNTLIFR